MEENVSNETVVDTTVENTSGETQDTDSQSSEQVDTTQQVDQFTSDMGIQEKEETVETVESMPTIDDIVAEAMTGEISEETQKLIEQNGLGKHLDMLVAGHKAIQEKNNNEVFEAVGGKDSYMELQEWGQNNLSEAEQSAFNSALFSGDMNLAKLAVEGLKARYVAKNGQAPSRVIEGGGTVNADSRPFADVQEYINQTRTYEYKSNPEHRAKIEAKRNLSGF